MIDTKWTGEAPDGARPAIVLVAILGLSNDAEKAKDPFERRMRLNELQAAIQGIKAELEAYAEGLIFGAD